MKLTLTVQEKLVLISLIPIHWGLRKHIVARALMPKILIKKEEAKELGMREETDKQGRPTGYKWDKEKDMEVNITVEELNLLKDRVRELDDQEKITQDILSLCIKIRDYKMPNGE